MDTEVFFRLGFIRRPKFYVETHLSEQKKTKFQTGKRISEETPKSMPITDSQSINLYAILTSVRI